MWCVLPFCVCVSVCVCETESEATENAAVCAVCLALNSTKRPLLLPPSLVCTCAQDRVVRTYADFVGSSSSSSSAAQTRALDGVSFAVREGECVGLLGPNGAGKTTLVRLVTGVDSPTAGRVAVRKGACRSHARGDGDGDGDGGISLGVCMQESIHFQELTVLEHVLLFSRIKAEAKTIAELLGELRAVGLAHKAHSLPEHLSGGMQRKLAICCALQASTTVSVLDEVSQL